MLTAQYGLSLIDYGPAAAACLAWNKHIIIIIIIIIIINAGLSVMYR